MKLHEDKTLFRQAIQFTADQMKIAAVYVEKDYWVTYALYTIFKSELGKDTVFKGGTALSKCYKMIERFSEDIDLVVLRREGEADAKMKNKLKAISSVVNEVLPEIEVEGITNKKGMNRKTAHNYGKEFSGDYGQVRDIIVLESTWLGYPEPSTNRMLVSFVGDMMTNNGQEAVANEHGLLPFEVQVLEPTRTVCEKIMSLVRFSYEENPVEVLKKKIRHAYDLHQLLQQKEFSDFLNSADFDVMLLKVANDDVASYKNFNKWLVHHPVEALVFKDLENVWKDLAPVYNNEFGKLVYGNLPDQNAVQETLKMIRERLKKVSWNINPDTKE